MGNIHVKLFEILTSDSEVCYSKKKFMDDARRPAGRWMMTNHNNSCEQENLTDEAK